MVASSNEPWLRVVPTNAFARRRWVRVRYSSSYFDDPVRPMIRFDTVHERPFIQFMNGPVLGTGEWMGRVPENTTAISISPVNRPGIFDFQLDAIKGVTRRDLIRRGLGYDLGPFRARALEQDRLLGPLDHLAQAGQRHRLVVNFDLAHVDEPVHERPAGISPGRSWKRQNSSWSSDLPAYTRLSNAWLLVQSHRIPTGRASRRRPRVARVSDE